jgi:hypothetical protein
MQADQHTSQARPGVNPDETADRARARRRFARNPLLYRLCVSDPGDHRQQDSDLTDVPH